MSVTNNELVSAIDKLRGIVSAIIAEQKRVEQDQDLTPIGKASRLDSYIDGSGLMASRDRLVQILGERAEQVDAERVQGILDKLRDTEHQRYVSRAVEAIVNNYVDGKTARAIAETLGDDSVSLELLKAKAARAGVYVDYPAIKPKPGYDGMAREIKNAVTPKAIKSNAPVVLILLDDYKREVVGV